MSRANLLHYNQLVARRLGIGRRKAVDLIVAGKVRVDGKTIADPTLRFHSDAEISVTGYRVQPELEKHLTVAFNKPTQVVTSWSDEEGRPDLSAFFPDRPASLRYAGRLDFMTGGLLILSTDGDLIHRLTHPRFGAERVYRIWIHGGLAPEQITAISSFTGGGPRRGKRTIEMQQIGKWGKGERWLLRLRQGENRQIRSAFDHVGVKIHRLQRIAHGPYELGNLKPGEWKPVEKLPIAPPVKRGHRETGAAKRPR